MNLINYDGNYPQPGATPESEPLRNNFTVLGNAAGLFVSETPVPSLRVQVGTGSYSIDGVSTIHFIGGTTDEINVSTGMIVDQHRIALLTIDSMGGLNWLYGSAVNVAVTPVPPLYPTNQIPLAEIRTKYGIISVTSDLIADVRPLINLGGAGGGGSGATGPAGPIGATGLPGPQGPRGFTGARGFTGIGSTGLSGPTGAVGPAGITGAGIQGITGLKGDRGVTGLQGVQGIQGPQGIQGDTGIQGVAGDQGVTGVQGIQGDTGIQGVAGDQGVTGQQGVTGLGTTGLQGITGLTGQQGITGVGVTGPAGPEGQTGPQGTTGLQGAQGDTGAQGATGIQGGIGPQGETGPQGLTGIQGNTGPQGSTGLQGSTGIQGETGLRGSTGSIEQGETGVQGIQGPQGTQGDTGVQGNAGIQGPTGVQGVTGLTGTQGETGVQGDTGVQGIQGITGLKGDQGVTGLQGVQGIQGPQGIQGDTGIQGETGVQGVTGLGTQGDTGAQGIQGATGAGSGGGTLDDAYDHGGAGAGRTITVDSGAVQLTVAANSMPALDINMGGNYPFIQLDVTNTDGRTRGDIYFAPTYRSSDPPSSVVGDFWYLADATGHFKYKGNSTVRTLVSSDDKGSVTIDCTTTSNAIALTIQSSSTGGPTVTLKRNSGTRNRGDFYFDPTNRGSDPSAFKGDFWYNSTTDTFKYQASAGVRVISTTTHSNGGASLQDAYNAGGFALGKTITTALNNPVIINANGSGITVNQTNASSGSALATFTQDGSGNVIYVDKNNTSTGNCVEIDNSGTGDGIQIDQLGNGTALDINQFSTAATANVVEITNSGSGDAVQIYSVGGGSGIDINSTEGIGIRIDSSTTASTGTYALRVAATNASSAIYVTQAGAAYALSIDQNTNATAVNIDKTPSGTGNGIRVSNSGTGDCIELNSASNNDCIMIDINRTSTAGTNPVIDIINSGGGYDIDGNASNWFIQKDGVIKLGVIGSASRPSSPVQGMMVWDTNVNAPIVYDGAAWVKITTAST